MPALLERYEVPGAAVALIRDGTVVWERGFGLADVASAREVTPQTLFNVGSISKMPTAWAVMRLVQAGKIDLDQPVDTYLKRWHLPPSSFDNRQVTVRRVLSHTSGISNHDYHGWDPTSPLPAIEDSLRGEAGTGEVHVEREPGSAFYYSGANYSILQLLVEDVTGESFTDHMHSHLFQPLGMGHTQYGLPTGFPSDMATPYDTLGKALPILRYNELAAAGMTTTLHDLAIFAAAGLPAKSEPPGRHILGARWIEAMQSPAPHSKWADKDPYGPDPQYGLGHTVRPSQFAGRVGVGHGGTNNGWESLVQVVPSTRDGIVIMTNSSNGSAIVASVLCYWRQWAAGMSADCPTIDVRIPILQAYKRDGVQAAISLYRSLYRDEPERFDFSVNQLNSLGYQVLRLGDVSGAVQIFKLNVEQFPREWSVYDSLGEALLKLGDREEAIANYKKSVELNPYNENGLQVLRSLEAT